MKYYLAMKRNEVLTHATTWMSLEYVMLTEEISHKGRILYDSIYTKCAE